MWKRWMRGVVMSATNEEQIVTTAREAIKSLALPYDTIVVRIGGEFAAGIATSDTRTVVDGLYVVPAREMLGVRPTPNSIRRFCDVNGQHIDVLMDDIGHVLGRIARGEVFGFELLFGGGRDGWMLVDTCADIDNTFIVGRDLLSDVHVLDMLNSVRMDCQRVERTFCGFRFAVDIIRHALMAFCLAKIGDVVIPLPLQLAIAGNHIRASTFGGIERFIKRMRSDGMFAELRRDEQRGESGVVAWIQDITSATTVALKERHLPPLPPANAISRANDFVVELRERVGREHKHELQVMTSIGRMGNDPQVHGLLAAMSLRDIIDEDHADVEEMYQRLVCGAGDGGRT